MSESTIYAICDIAFMTFVTAMIMGAFWLMGIPVWYALPYLAIEGWKWFFGRGK